MAWLERRIALAAAVLAISFVGAGAQERYGIGRLATPAEIAGWNIDIGRDGSNLPAGKGSVERGRVVFAEQCAACHGAEGQGGLGDRLVGGQNTLATPKPVRTVGSYWPYAPTLFDYIRRAMPWPSPRTLSDNEVYALTAYILASNKLIGEGDTMDAKTLPQVKMPNRDNFIIKFPDKI
jgi:cytochrome c